MAMIMKPIGRAYMPRKLGVQRPTYNLPPQAIQRIPRGAAFRPQKLVLARNAAANAMQAVEGLGVDLESAGAALTNVLQQGTNLYLQREDAKAAQAAATMAQQQASWAQQQAAADAKAAAELTALAQQRNQAAADAAKRKNLMIWGGTGAAVLVGAGILFLVLRRKG